MGIFSFLKKKEPPLTIKVQDVEQWLVHHQELLGLDHHFSVFISEMKRHIKHAMERMDILASAELTNSNIPQRAKQVMEGHREQYIKRINDFINNLEIPKELDQLTKFAEEFSNKVEHLQVDTQKNVFVLKEFFEREATNIAKIIGEMDKSIASLRNTYEKLGKEEIDETYKKLADYHNIHKKIEQLNHALEEEKKKKSEPKEKLEKIEKKIEELSTSRGFLFAKGLETELENTKEELQKKIAYIKTTVSPLTTALKKLGKETGKEKTTNKYQKDFVDALLEDEELTIADVIASLENNIDKLGLKEAQKEKTIKAAKKITKKWLSDKKKAIIDLEKKEIEIKDRITKDTTKLLINEQERWKASIIEHLAEMDKNIIMIENELERLSPRLTFQKLRDSVKKLKENVIVEE